MEFSEKPFKTYDIRGIYPDEINEETAYRVGRAFVKHLNCKKVVIGRDCRLSSDALFDTLSRGIMDEGADVLDIGKCTTPMLSFAVACGKYGVEGGIMISASHNPGKYNAFKLIKPPALQIFSDEIQEIKALALKKDFMSQEKGTLEKKDILRDYIAHVSQFTKDIKGLKIVCDYANGMGSLSALPLYKDLDIEVINMYEKIDCTFPNHPANPHDAENLNEIRKKVVEEGADAGFFFDGDADRAIVIDEKGDIIFPDILLALLAPDELKKFPGGKVYFDLRFSHIVSDVIKQHGGEPVVSKVGNPYYKTPLMTEGGTLGGELSGHMMFKEDFFIDDGLFVTVKVMTLLSKSGKRLSELVAPLLKYFNTPEINTKVSTFDIADRIIADLEEKYKDEKIMHLDGLTVEAEDWWFNLRKSNTEPIIRLRIEADTAEKLAEMKKTLIEFIDERNR